MKRISSLALIALLSSMVQSNATTVTFSALPTSRVIDDSSGVTALPAGDLVLVGMFSKSLSQLQADSAFQLNATQSIAANVAAMQAEGGWSQFSPSTLATTSAGKISGSLVDSTAAATAFNGSLIYVWVFNASSVGAATQMGIYTAGSGATPAWVFPTNGSVPDLVTPSTASGATPSMISVGAGSVQGTNGSGAMVLAAAVPEPSTLATLAGATGLLGMMRRRKVAR